ncbi:hemagglutinin repeat-containing protein [Variovorax sp. RHLX14]|uniref:hemagglutinin repeat-containing protein n=1 Tax=Variovorax sp. RHLX14 TaxID=1259731 RepID=UPI003F44FE02
MNKNFHRVIFNVARRMRMVVQETARSVGRSTGTSIRTATRASIGTSSPRSAAVGVLVFIASLTAVSAAAQIAADRNAPGNQRPTVLVAPNGVPLVDIRTPSAAGVSRNTYRQFDVNGNGAILNNSRTDVQTQLGGYVQGNPWLARGSARVIVNEVNSSNPSYLRGFVEVAGPRAEVIIANPSGIFVNGAGFINASRATLTTGTPQFGLSGDLESYVVRGGAIGILGAGLDASTTDSLSILSRAFELSGALHATDFKVIAGANRISTDLTGITPIAGTNNAPAYALDVGQLGGMYANHIALVVNENGVGARNTGTIQTSTGTYALAGVGKLTLSVDGMLENSGLIRAASDAAIGAARVVNSGTIEGQRVELNSVAGNIDNRAGTIRQTGTADLTVAALSLSNTNAGFIGAEPVTPSGSSGSGSTAASPVVSPGSLTAVGAILNDGGKIYTGGDIALQTPSVNNDGGTLKVANLNVGGPSFSNAGGKLNVTNAFTAHVGAFDNARGSLHAGTIGVATTGDLDNRGGTLASDGGVGLTVGGAVDNTGGTVSAVGALHATVAGALDNTAGKLLGNTGATVVAGSLNNTLGAVQSASGATRLGIADRLSNDKGSIGAGTDVSIQAGSLANIGTAGEIRAENDSTVAVVHSLSNGGRITSGRHTTVTAENLDGNSTGVLGAGIGSDGSLGTTGNLSVATTESLKVAGTLLAAGNVALTAIAGNVDTSGATVTTPGTLTVTANTSASQSLVNEAGTLSAGQLNLQASNIRNTRAGQIVQTGTGATTIAVTGTLDNSAGRIASNGQELTLAAATLLNTGGFLQHAGAGTLGIAATTFDGASGSIVGSGELVVRAGSFRQDGATTKARQITIDAGSLSNAGGTIVQTGTGTTRIAAAGTLDNDHGTVTTNAIDVELSAATFRNKAGSVQHAGAGTLDISATQTFSGAKGQISSNGVLYAHGGDFDLDGGTTSARRVFVETASLSNRAGQIVQTGTGTTRIATAGNIFNDGGTIATNATDVELAAGGTLSNADGLLQHAGAGSMNLTAGNYAGPRGKIVSNGALRANVAGAFDQSGGTTTAKQVAIDAGSLGNVDGTLIQTGTAATRISTRDDLNNDGGTIATNAVDVELLAGGTLSNASGKFQHVGTGNLNLAAGAYSGAKGELVTNGALVASVAGAFGQDDGSTSANQVTIDAGSLSNVAGDIAQIGSGAARISITGTLDNTAGRIGSNGSDVTLAAATLQNTGGTLQHAGTGAMNITAPTFSGANGRILGNGTLNVRAGAFNQDGGNTSSKLIAIDAADIGNVGGSIVQTGTGVTRIAATGTLTNDSGTIASNGADMNLSAGGTLSNANGHLQHAGTGALMLTAGSYSGANGEITTNDALVANVAGAFDQDGGSTSARQITVHAGSLSNRSGEIVQTGTAAATLAVAGVLDNSANGSIASNGNLTVAAASLINRGGSVRSAGTASLDLITSGLLDNSDSGAIGAGGNAVLRAGSLMNDAGSVTAVGDLNATVTGATSNVNGTLAANGNTTVSAATLDNTRGSVAAVTGDLSVTTVGATVNTAGTLQAAGSASLVNTGLANTQGKVTGNALSANTHGEALNNALGTLAATTAIDLQTGVLNNDRGLVQSGGAMTIDTHGQALTNTNATGHSSGQGGIASGSTLAVNAGSVDNTAGFVGANDTLTANIGGFTNNAGGVVLGKADVAIATNGATYDNRGGKTLALGNLTIDTGNGAIQNSGALIRSTGSTTLAASTVDNSATLGTDQGIEGNNVAIAATTLNNNAGAIRADANATITSAGTVSNINGLISAGDTLALLDPNRSNALAKTLSVVNTGGTLTARKSLQLDAATFSADGTLSSDQDLSIALTQNLVNNATVSANRNLTYTTTGTLTNNGKLLAGNVLTVSGSDVENAATGEMRGDTTIVRASGTLTNRGLIDGRDTQVDAGALVNAPTGRIYGDHLSIAAGSVRNDADATSAATIAARDRLDIGSDSIVNRDGASIFSGGDLFIGGALDANRQATGSASLLENKAATIEALNNVDIKATTLKNLNGGVTWRMEPKTEQVLEFAPPGSTERFKASDVLIASFTASGWTAVPGFAPDTDDNNANTRLLIPSPSYPLTKFATYYAKSPAPSNDSSYQMPSGIADEVVTVSVPGAWYGSADPIWAAFGITAPVRDMPADNPVRLDRDLTVGQTATQYGKLLDHPVTQAEYDEAQTYYAAHTALDQATQTFVNTVTAGTSGPGAAAATPNGFYRDYSIWMYTATTDNPVLSTSAPAKIVSGGDMTLTVGSGSGSTNDMSQILAGRTLTVTGATIANKPVEVLATTAVSGTALTTEVVNHTFSSSKRRYDSAVFDLVIPPKTVTLAAARQEGNQNATSGKAPGASTFTATGTNTSSAGAVDAGNRVNPILEVPSAVGGTPGITGNSASVANAGNGSGVTGGSAGGASTNGATSAAATPIGNGAGMSAATASGSAASASTPVSGVTKTGASASQSLVIRTTAPDTSIPTASLFRTIPGPASHYLVETDPAFASYRSWLSSDYLLDALAYDPATVTKRLGDGFYEQRLIREQVAQLTGYRYLEGSKDDQDQYAALMNAGATFAKAYQLTPGIGLSAAQMAQLTSDIVWLVEQTVTLPDGTTQKVLAPQVYVRVRPGDIDGSGALLSADALVIRNQPGQGDLINSGTIAGRTMVSITADNVQNLNGRITGGSVGIEARNDLNSIGGTIDAQNAVSLKAGRDITIQSTTQAAVGAKSSSTQLDRIAGVYVTNPEGTLVASAGHDVNLVGAILSNAGADGVTSIKAVNDINLGTIATSSSQDTTWNAKNFSRSSQSAEVGSTISTDGTTVLNAGRDVNIRQGTVSTEGTLAVLAGHDVNIESGSASQSLDSASYKKSRGFLSSKSITRQESTSQTTIVGSSLSGKDVLVSAGNDLTVSGSQVIAQEQLSLSAGRDVRIQSTEETASQSSAATQRKSGLSASVLTGVSYGKSAGAQNQTGQSTTQIGSTLSGGNVSIDAGRDARIIASTVVADKDIAITAGRNIDVLAATDTQRSASSSQSASTSIGLVSGIAPRQTMYGSIKGAENGTGESRTAVTSLLSANNGNLTLVAGLDPQYKGMGQGNITTEGADLLAKDKVTLSGNAVRLMAATSSGDSAHRAQSKSVTLGSQLTGVVGSQITRAYDMAQASQSTTDSRLKGAQELKAGYDAYKLASSGALGAGIADAAATGTGGDPSGAAFGVSVSVSSSKSRQDNAESFTQQRGTNIQAGAIDITARETDIDMQGAKLQARDIALDAKRNINLVAAQNTAETQGSNSGSSLGFGVTAGIGSQNGVSFQLSASSSKGKSNGTETSYDNTLVTATDSLSIKSGGDTNLIGAQIAANRVKADIGGNLNIESLQDRTEYESKQTSGGFDMSLCVPPICYGQVVTASANYAKQAVDHNYRSATGQSGIAAGDGGFDVTVKGNTDLKGGAITSAAGIGKNSFATGSLTTSDLVNTQNTNTSSESLSVSYGSDWSSAAANAANSVTNTALSNLNGGRGLPADRNEIGQTLSVLSPANVKITGTGNAVTDAMTDAKSAENVATLTSRDAATANGALINSLTLQQAQDLPRKQQEAQARQQAAQLLGSVVGNAIGDVSAQLGWAEGSPQKIALHALAGIVQAKVGDGSVLAGAAAGAVNEAVLPAMEGYLESQGIRRYNANGTPNASFSELLTAGSTLLGAAVGATAGGTGSAGVGATVANNATVNNFLKHADVDKLAKKIEDCGGDPSCKDKAMDEAYRVSAANDIALLNCKSTNSCDVLKAEYREGYRAIEDLVGRGMKPEDVGRVLNLETNAQTIIRSGLDQRQCTTQACQDNAAYLTGIGKGLAKITPAGLVTGSGIASYELTTAIIDNGLAETAVAVVQGIAGLPADLKNKLNSNDAQVRGEALVDTLSLAGVATAVTAKMGQVGHAATVKQLEAKVAQAAEAEAIAKAKVEGNLRRDDAQQYDQFHNAKGDGWDWQKQAPNDGAVPGTTQNTTINEGKIVDRYGSRRGEYMSPVGTPLGQRSLPPGKAADVYEQYIAQKSFAVTSEEIAPAFGQVGGGSQLRARIPEVPGDYASIEQLIQHGYLKVKP